MCLSTICVWPGKSTSCDIHVDLSIIARFGLHGRRRMRRAIITLNRTEAYFHATPSAVYPRLPPAFGVAYSGEQCTRFLHLTKPHLAGFQLKTTPQVAWVFRQCSAELLSSIWQQYTGEQWRSEGTGITETNLKPLLRGVTSNKHLLLYKNII